jgi:hypothetical protein
MNDHIRPDVSHGPRDLNGIKRVGDYRRGTQVIEQRLLGLTTGHPMDLMTRSDQTRYKLSSDCPGRTCHK